MDYPIHIACMELSILYFKDCHSGAYLGHFKEYTLKKESLEVLPKWKGENADRNGFRAFHEFK